MQAGKGADDFEVAQFLRPDIHQEILALGILTVETLNRVLHRRREFSVRSAELLEQHVSERRVRGVDTNRVHQLFYVVVHETSVGCTPWDANRFCWQPCHCKYEDLDQTRVLNGWSRGHRREQDLYMR